MKNKINWSDKIVLITGGTGSFGQKFVEIMLDKYKPKVIRIFSRDEMKQWEMIQKFKSASSLRFFIGNVRDYKRLKRAMEGVDIVVHAAALKQVPLCEYNPFEAVSTNILGAENVVDAAIDCNVERVMAISTDKAVAPVNLYGATKMCMEKLIVAANSYVGLKRKTKLSCVRYGNVLGSRGSVVQLFKDQKKKGKLTITDLRMTRFWITIEQGVEFVISCMNMMNGGEVFIPKIPSMKIEKLAKVIAPESEIKVIGIRPGEKLHEFLVTEDEGRHTKEFNDFFIIEPEYKWWTEDRRTSGKNLPEKFSYKSNENSWWLSDEELKEMLKEL